MQTTHDDEDGEWKPGPISLMMDDFHAYTDAIRTAHEGPEKEAELLAKVKAQYPDIEWDKDAGPVDEHIPEDDEQQYDESTVDRIHGRASSVSPACLLVRTSHPTVPLPFLLPPLRHSHCECL